MSHVATVELEIKDLGALEIAANRLGLELCRYQTTYRWFGTSVGDYPLPEGFTAEDLGKCEHALRVHGVADRAAAGAPYEIGVVRRRDGKEGFLLMWDFWAGGLGLQERVGAGCNKLKVEYARAVAVKQAQAAGFRVNEHRRADGSIQLQLQR